jgi:hypothetical protein
MQAKRFRRGGYFQFILNKYLDGFIIDRIFFIEVFAQQPGDYSFINVDFPAPLGPISPIKFGVSICMVTSRSTVFQ